MTGQPTQVRVAVLLLRLVGIGYLIDAAMLLAGAGAYSDQLQQAARDSGIDRQVIDRFEWVSSWPLYVAILLSIGAAASLLLVAQSVRAGHYAGRVVAWVGIGLALMCGSLAVGVGGTPAFSGNGYVTLNSVDASGTQASFAQYISEGYPPAYQYVSAGIAGFAMIALLIVAVLLALPASSLFFRPALRREVVAAQAGPGGQPLPPAAPAPRAAGHDAERRSREAELATLSRRHARGELTDEEFEVARQRLSGHGHRG